MPTETIPPKPLNQLHRWRVMEAVWSGDVRTRHVCAENAENKIGVSTSSIREFDPVAMSVKTRSGKIYFLAGQPEASRLAEAAWRKWRGENEILAEHDVTGEYLKNGSNPTQAPTRTPTITFKKIGFRYDDTITN